MIKHSIILFFMVIIMKINDLMKLLEIISNEYPECEITNCMCLKDGTCNMFIKKAGANKGVKIHSSEFDCR